jgi:hypothetical protein
MPTPYFKPGNPGRPPGIPNRNTRAIIESLGFVWERVAVERALDTSLPHASRDFALGLIADRMSPKLKAIEVTGGVESIKNILINVIAGAQQGTAIEAVAVPQTLSSEVIEAIVQDDQDDDDGNPSS